MGKLLSMAALAMLVSLSPGFAAPKTPAQTIAAWTEHAAGSATLHYDYVVTVHGGVLDVRFTQFDPGNLRAAGYWTKYTIKLSRVTQFTKDTFTNDDGSQIQRIGVDMKGLDDLVIHEQFEPMSTLSGMPGLLNFDPDQEAMRDDVYAKLCALIGQTP